MADTSIPILYGESLSAKRVSSGRFEKGRSRYLNDNLRIKRAREVCLDSVRTSCEICSLLLIVIV